MTTLRYFTGHDPKDEAALDVCLSSLRHHSTIDIAVTVIKEHELRRAGLYWRSYRVDERGQMWDDRDGKPFSTQFSFTRFAVPLLAGDAAQDAAARDAGDDWVLWSDPDFLWRADVAELLALAEAQPDKALLCVQHDHRPPEAEKMGGGALQNHYARKNWSSLMLMRPSACRAHGLDKYALNNWRGENLHRLLFVPDELIGALPEAWNWLCGWSSPEIEPKAVHYTRGTPDMPGHEDEPFADEWRFCLRHRKPPACGGILKMDRPLLVGERGWELFSPGHAE